jgi:hypothetical protein
VVISWVPICRHLLLYFHPSTVHCFGLSTLIVNRLITIALSTSDIPDTFHLSITHHVDVAIVDHHYHYPTFTASVEHTRSRCGSVVDVTATSNKSCAGQTEEFCSAVYFPFCRRQFIALHSRVQFNVLFTKLVIVLGRYGYGARGGPSSDNLLTRFM